MKTRAPLILLPLIGLSLMLAPLSLAAGSTAKSGAATNLVARIPEAEIPQSVFVIPATPAEGRNPFFPRSTSVAPVVRTKQGVVETQSFVLNGITSPPKQTAMINGTTFEAGEEHELRLPGGGKMLVKCEEIRADSAVILAGGIRRELRMRFGL